MKKEEVTLGEVKQDVLKLIDGRRLRVNPGDISTSILWLPPSMLEISDMEEGGFFDLCVALQGTEQNIRARWE